VEPAVFDLFPGLRLVLVAAHGVDNETPRPTVARAWAEAWAAAARLPIESPQSHPRVAPWRAAFRAMGVSPREFPSSVEALVRRARKGGPPFAVNPLVDFYNSVSLTHLVPVGGFGLDDLHGPIELRRTRPGDRYLALDATAPVAVPAGEIAYADGEVVLTRHFVWRQAREGLIRPESRSVLLLSEILADVGAEVAEAVRRDLAVGLERHFGVRPTSTVLSADTPTWTFGTDQ
jgi:DNA/RNA-binding domain of Phe-tRNA-synthetase-like protein